MLMDMKEKKCLPCEAGVKPILVEEAQTLLRELNEWVLSPDEKKIRKIFKFKNYYHTIGFVNAIAWIAHQENHHPDLNVSYNQCIVEYSTHAIDGLSNNDFICAAKVDALVSS
jgi:4a-hydroxytetrahydrobiopterin dehydratase